MIYVQLVLDCERNWHSKNCPHRNDYPFFGLENKPDFTYFTESIPYFNYISDNTDSKFTFMVSSELAEDCIDVLKQLEKEGHEIGCHTHPYVHINDEKMLNQDYDKLSYYSGYDQEYFISRDVNKLRRLGLKIQSFRAGRFAINHITLKILEKYNFLIDLSLVSKKMFLLPMIPYYPNKNNIQKIGDMKILEFVQTFDLNPFTDLHSLYSKLPFYKYINQYLHSTLLIGLHPMEYSDPHINVKNSYNKIEEMLLYLIDDSDYSVNKTLSYIEPFFKHNNNKLLHTYKKVIMKIIPNFMYRYSG